MPRIVRKAVVLGDLVTPLSPLETRGTPYWGNNKLLKLAVDARRPRGLREWAAAFWNTDIFFGEVPVCKATVTLSFIFSALAAVIF